MPDCHGRRVLAVRVEAAGAAATSTRFGDVRDHVLVELLRPALLDHQRRVPLVVGEDDDVAVDRLAAARAGAWIFPKYSAFDVDVLDVVDLDARLLRELRRASGASSPSRRCRCRAASSRSGACRRALRTSARTAAAATARRMRPRSLGSRRAPRRTRHAAGALLRVERRIHATLLRAAGSTTKSASGSNAE